MTALEFDRAALPLLGSLRGAALRMTRDPVVADDLVQDVMVRAWRFWSSFDGSDVRGWMFTILRNTFITGYHKRSRADRLDREVAAQVRLIGDVAAVCGTSTVARAADAAIDCAASVQHVRDAIDSLPADYRTAVTMADLDGYAYREISEAMGCPIGTVMSRVYRGRKMLRVALAEHAADVGMASAAE